MPELGRGERPNAASRCFTHIPSCPQRLQKVQVKVTQHCVPIKFSVLTSRKNLPPGINSKERIEDRNAAVGVSFFPFARPAPHASWSVIRSLWTFQYCPEAHQSTAGTASPSDSGTKISTHEFLFFIVSYKVPMCFIL